MSAKARPYYQLFFLASGGYWVPDFGDYSKKIVQAEWRDYRDNGYKASQLKVVTLADDKKATCEAMQRELNLKQIAK